MIVIETERLTLRRLTTADAPFIVDLLNQPSFLRFIGDKGVRSIGDAERYIVQGPIESYERLGFGLYLIELKDGREPIGICGLIRRETLSDVDLGFALLPQFWSKGYAFEAASAVMDYARSVLGIERILAIVLPENERSISVLERVGFRFESTISWPDDGKTLKLYAADK